MNIVKVLEYGSHIRTIIELLTDAFHTGRTYERSTSPTEPYKKMLDEAIGINTVALLREALETTGADVNHLYEEMARYFQRHPIYIPALRESLAAVSDVTARVNMLKEFAIANEAEKGMLCQMMDQRHPVAKALYERFFKASRTWKHIIARELGAEQARHIREFLESLSWLQKHQFTLSVGGLSNTEDHMAVLNEVLAGYPDLGAMAEIAATRGLIKRVNTHVPEEVRGIFEEVASVFTGRISAAARAVDDECASLAQQLHRINQEKRRERREHQMSLGSCLLWLFTGIRRS